MLGYDNLHDDDDDNYDDDDDNYDEDNDDDEDNNVSNSNNNDYNYYAYASVFIILLHQRVTAVGFQTNLGTKNSEHSRENAALNVSLFPKDHNVPQEKNIINQL